MEVAKIDWQKIESVFVEDQVYETINAPQWVDLLSPLPGPADDIAWFCRSDCRHPITAEDFLNSTPPSSFKLLRSASVSKLIGLVDWTRPGEPDLRRRGGVPHSSTGNGDSENQDPNFSTPNRQISYLNKAVIKSSAYKSEEEYSDIVLDDSHDKIKPVLKATQSAKDLFGGSKDLFGKITEFCHVLKNMATLVPKENEEKLSPDSKNCYKPVEEIKTDRPRERLPLLEVGKDRIDTAEAAIKSNAKGKPRKNKIKRADETENIPVSLNLNHIKRKEEGKVLSIRTNPPTPQGFSVNRRLIKTTPPCKSPKSRLMERETIDEAGQNKRGKEEEGETRNGARTLDVFWLFKPCTTLSS